jgi:hypothetical protein
MEILIKDKTIILKDKELNTLDKEVIKIVNLINFDYVIMSGYIAILFGRSRATEDVDMFIEPSKEAFYKFCDKLSKNGFYMINAGDKEEAYEFLKEGISIRIAEEGKFIPNFEMKLPKKEIDRMTFRSKIKVKLGNIELNIAELEPQIAFKLFLGSEKDYLDAKHLYDVLERYLDKDKLHSYINMFGVNTNITEKVLRIKMD